MLKKFFIQQQLQWYVKLNVFSVVSVFLFYFETLFPIGVSRLPFPCVFSHHV